MANRLCAREGCGMRKSASVHLMVNADSHEYMSDKPVGIQPIGADKRAYLASRKHREVYAEALGDNFCVGHAAGAPGRCTPPLTPHHILPKSQAGGQERAEDFPVVMLCAWLNDAVQADAEVRAWAKSHYFHRNGRDWPFLLSSSDAREIEAQRESAPGQDAPSSVKRSRLR